MYIFMLTEGIICARFNAGSNMLVCVVSCYNYSMVYYLLVYTYSHSFNLNVNNKYTTQHCLSCIEAVSI